LSIGIIDNRTICAGAHFTVTLFVPRSKLGLNLPVEKILQKKQCNPVALLAEMVMEKTDAGKWAMQGRDRLMALCRLMEYQKPKPKSYEVKTERDTRPHITLKGFIKQDAVELEQPRIEITDEGLDGD
jgi:hypothetical protein